MKRYAAFLVFLSSIVTEANAHFLWLELEPEQKEKVALRFAEMPRQATPDSLQTKAAPMKVFAHDYAEIVMSKGQDALTGPIEPAAEFCTGKLAYGVLERETGGPFLLNYFAKGVRNVEAARTPRGLPVEVVADIVNGKLKLTVLHAGKPVKGAEVYATLPQEKEEIDAFSDDNGNAEFPVTKSGWIGVRALVEEDGKGEFDGKPYGFIKNYSTLTFSYELPRSAE